MIILLKMYYLFLWYKDGTGGCSTCMTDCASCTNGT